MSSIRGHIDDDDKSLDERSPLVVRNNIEESPTAMSLRYAENQGGEQEDETQNEDDVHGSTMLETIVEDAAALVEHVMQDATAMMEQVVEEIREEVHEVAGTVLEELQDADEPGFHYLEMGLTRNLSILPVDIVETSAELQPEVPTTPIEMVKDPEQDMLIKEIDRIPGTPKTPISAYFLLLSAVVSLSSIGALLNLQKDVSSTLKIGWRMCGTAMMLFPFACTTVVREGFPSLTPPQWVTFFLSALCYSIMVVGFCEALNYTAVGNAVILSNSLALILLMGKLLVGDPVSFVEGAGAVVAFCGAALCSKDSAESRSHGDSPASGLFGDSLAILSAFGGLGYLIFAKTCRAHVPLYVLMFMIMACGCVMVVSFDVLVLNEKVTLDRHPNHGVFGFLNLEPDRLPLEVAMVFVCNFLGATGYIRAMQYFDNLVISSAALLEPVVAEFLAFAFGVGVLPGWQGWLGNVLVAGGTFAVISRDSGKGGGH